MDIIREEKLGEKKPSRIYTKDDLVRAVEYFVANEKDFSMALVAKLFNIPYQTLSDNIKKRHQKLKDHTIPSLNDSTTLEKDIMKGINLASQNGWVLSKDIIIEGVHKYCSENPLLTNMFPNSDMQKQWACNFYTKHRNEITETKEESLHLLAEENNCFKHLQKTFFKLLLNKLTKLGVMNENRKMFVLTEFCLETQHNCKEKSYNSLLCCNAAGEFLSPNVIYKDSQSGQCNYEIQGQPSHMKSFTSISGYLDDKTFELWLKKQFLPFLCENNIRLPVVLIIDGHGSQMTYNIVQRAEALEVSLMCLPSHSTEDLHPFSMGILKSLEMNWLEIRTTFYQRSKLKEISEFTFPLLLKQLYGKLLSNRDSVINGFAACGLCPFNENIMDEQGSSLENTYLGNEDVNLQKSKRDLKANICHGANNKILNGVKTPDSLKYTKNKKKRKKTTNSSQMLKRSTLSQDSQNLKKIKTSQKYQMSQYKDSGKPFLEPSKMPQKYINSSTEAEPKPEKSLQGSEDFQPPLTFIPVNIKPEEKIFSEPESEIIISLEKFRDSSSSYTNSVNNFNKSLQKLEKIHKLKKCFIPLENIIGKYNIRSSETSPKESDSLHQSVVDLSKYIVAASCDGVKQELDFTGNQEKDFQDFEVSAIKKEREVKFINIASIRDETDVRYLEFPTFDFDDQENDLTEAKIPDLNNTSTLEEKYELNLFPKFVNDLPEKHTDAETSVNNNRNIFTSVFLNNWNNETRKELQKVRLKLQLSNSSECDKDLRGVYKEKKLKKTPGSKRRTKKRKKLL